jgi:hypothetical protein
MFLNRESNFVNFATSAQQNDKLTCNHKICSTVRKKMILQAEVTEFYLF